MATGGGSIGGTSAGGTGASTTTGGTTAGGTAAGGTSAGGASGVGGSSGAGTGGAPSLCEEYCETLDQGCPAELKQFSDRSICLAWCEALPIGDPSDETGNSVHCRLKQARIAVASPEREGNCPSAGPLGNGICGTDCQGYCAVFRGNCRAKFDAAFVSLLDCETACAALPNRGAYSLALEGVSGGNSVQCRAWHLSVAGIEPTPHCDHAAGAAPCQ